MHGIALAADVGARATSAPGRSGTASWRGSTLETLARLKEIKATGDNPDAVIYDDSRPGRAVHLQPARRPERRPAVFDAQHRCGDRHHRPRRQTGVRLVADGRGRVDVKL